MLNEYGALFEGYGDVDARAEVETTGEEQEEEEPEEDPTQLNDPDPSDLDPHLHQAEPETAEAEQTLVGRMPPNGLPCEGFIRHRPPQPHRRIGLALPSSGVDLASIQHPFDIEIRSTRKSCRINVESMLNRLPNRLLRRGGRGGFEGGVRGACA